MEAYHKINTLFKRDMADHGRLHDITTPGAAHAVDCPMYD